LMVGIVVHAPQATGVSAGPSEAWDLFRLGLSRAGAIIPPDRLILRQRMGY
jgi:hypothetical protein